jgi:chloramphenicol-sensitive protein RarD
MNSGILYALLAYVSWGVIPVYWSFLHEVSAYETVCLRVILSWIFYGILLKLRPQDLRKLSNKEKLFLLLAALLLAINWWVYVYAINSNQVTESSLGYFINPLMNFALGVFFLGEQLSRPKKAAVAAAVAGVAYLTWVNQSVPWIALALAITFGVYGLLKKKISVSSLQSGYFEMLVLLPVSVISMIQFFWSHPDVFAERSWQTWALILSIGPVSGTPLLWFASAAQRMKLSTLGFFQYLAPTLQFLLAMFYFHEAFDVHKAIGYALVWLGLAIVIIETALHMGRSRKV